MAGAEAEHGVGCGCDRTRAMIGFAASREMFASRLREDPAKGGEGATSPEGGSSAPVGRHPSAVVRAVVI